MYEILLVLSFLLILTGVPFWMSSHSKSDYGSLSLALTGAVGLLMLFWWPGQATMPWSLIATVVVLSAIWNRWKALKKSSVRPTQP